MLVAILYNPLPSNKKAKPLAVEISRLLEERQVPHEVYGQWPQSLDAFSDVWIAGGDGTLNYFLNRYPDVQKPLSIFKGGTGNDFAWKLYGKMDLPQQIQTVLQAPHRAVDACQCNERIYINSLGIGFDGEVLRQMRSVRKVGGHLGYLLVVLKKIFRFKEFSFKIETGADCFEGPYLIVMINNNQRTGGGFIVTPRAQVDDGLLDLMLCKKLSIIKRLWNLPVIEKGKHLDKSFIIHRLVKTASIRVSEQAFASLDGELIESSEFTINVLPGKYLFRY